MRFSRSISREGMDVSRRYGRNQKRRHREEIAQLRAAHGMNEALLRDQGRRLREARETIREMVRIIEAVCPYSVALPPKDMALHYGRHCRLEVRPPLSEMVFGPGDAVGFAPVEGRMVDLHALEMYLEERRDQFQMAVHLRYEGDGGRWGYMLSESALRSMPEEVILRGLLPEVGRQMIRALKEGLR